jgi:hypothetical protein
MMPMAMIAAFIAQSAKHNCPNSNYNTAMLTHLIYAAIFTISKGIYSSPSFSSNRVLITPSSVG